MATTPSEQSKESSTGTMPVFDPSEVDVAALADSLTSWCGQPDRPIEEVLQASGISDPMQVQAIQDYFERRMAELGDDGQTLGPMPSLPDLRGELEQLMASTAGGTLPLVQQGEARPSDPDAGLDPNVTTEGMRFWPSSPGSQTMTPFSPNDTDDPGTIVDGWPSAGAGDRPGGLAASNFEEQASSEWGPGGAKSGVPRSALGTSGSRPGFVPSQWDRKAIGSGGAEVADRSGLQTTAEFGAAALSPTQADGTSRPASWDQGQETLVEPRDPAGSGIRDATATAVFAPPSDVPSAASGSVLFRPSGERPAATLTTSRFRVLRQHAKGGLGAVMVAFDEELRREVALKEIREQHADDQISRARFMTEAEVTGGLEHPGVVPVYSLGRNPDGRPYYAMRFIRGESLRKALDTFHAEKHGLGESERQTKLRGFLRRFVDVCNALEYAHSRQVIHRDIKPDNIMLGPYGETLLVDWGLAKPLDRPELASRSELTPLRPSTSDDSTPTVDGSAIGTPAFMSPEQAVGDLARMGPGCDIYSLGATLYAILTGKPPFTDKNVFQILIKVKQGEFPRPREVDRSVPPALEAVCLKAMATSEADRYPTCRALADDVERWLADEPVSCYRDPFSVRLGRWTRRNRTMVASLGLLLPTVIVGLAGYSYAIAREKARTETQRQEAVTQKGIAEENAQTAQVAKGVALDQKEKAEAATALAIKNEEQARKNAEEAKRQEEIAQEKRAEAEEQRKLALVNGERAESNFDTAVGSVDALLTQVAEIELRDVPQMERTRRELLERALVYYTTFLQQNEDRRDALKPEVGRANGRVAEIQDLLGSYAPAEKAYAEAARLQRELIAAFPDDDAHKADLAKTLQDWGVMLKKLGRYQESEAALREAIALREDLSVKDAAISSRRRDLASARYQLGAVLARLQGRGDEAKAIYDQAIAAERELVSANPPDEQDERLLARYLNNLARLARTGGDESVKLFDEAIALQRNLIEKYSDVPSFRSELGWLLNNRAAIETGADPSRSEAPIQEAIEIGKGLTTDYPLVPDYWQELAAYQRNLGLALRRRGKEDEGRKVFTDALATMERSAEIRRELVRKYEPRPDYKQKLAMTLNTLATFYNLVGKTAEARATIDEATTVLSSLAAGAPEVYEYHRDFANVLRVAALLTDSVDQDPKAAAALATRAVAEAKTAHEDRLLDVDAHSALSGAYSTLANLLLKLKDHRAAAEATSKYLALWPDSGAEQIRGALQLAAACRLASDDGTLDEPAKRAALDGYKKSLLAALGNAIDLGFPNRELTLQAFQSDHKVLLADPAIKAMVDRIAVKE